MKKRFLSVLLVICMVLTLMPVSAFATDDVLTATAGPKDGTADIFVENGILVSNDENTGSISITVKAGADQEGVVVIGALKGGELAKVDNEDSVDVTVSLDGDNWIANPNKVTVSYGTETIEYTITVKQAVPTYTVSGMVDKGETDENVVNRIVTLDKKVGENNYTETQYVRTITGGAFTFEEVEAGTYRVTVTYSEETRDGWSSEEFTVNDNMADVTITLHVAPPASTTYTVSGTVDAGDLDVSVAGLEVQLLKQKTAEEFENTGKKATTGDDGSFTISGVAAGTYRVIVPESAGNYACSGSNKFTITNAPITDADITLVAEEGGEPEPPVSTGFTVSGTVGAGTTGVTDLSGIVVTLYTVADTDDGETATATTTTATTNSEGAFTFENVAAGKYQFVIAAVAGKYDKSPSDTVTISADKDDVSIVLFKKAEPTIDLAAVDGAYAKELEVAGTATINVTTDATVTATSSNTAAATVAVADKAVTITAKAVGKTTITITSPATDEYAAKTFTIAVTVKTKVLDLTVAVQTAVITDLGSMDPSNLQTLDAPVKDADTKTWKIRGTSKYVADWSEFSSVEGQTPGNYIALKLTSDEAEAAIKIISPSEGTNGVEKTLDSDGILVTNLANFPSKKATVTVVKTFGDDDNAITVTTDWTLDFTGVTPVAASEDASLTVEVTTPAGAAVDTPEATGDNAINNPDEIKVSFPGDTESTALSSASVKLTVNPNATVKFVNAAEAPADDNAYEAGNTASLTNGVADITADLSNPVYVKVTPQSGPAKYYKITAEITKIVVDEPKTVADIPDSINNSITGEDATDIANKQEALENAAKGTGVDDNTLKEVALATVNADEELKSEAKTALKSFMAEDFDEESTTVYIHVIPTVKVEVKTYNETQKTYSVDVKPVAVIVASDLETTPDADKYDGDNDDDTAVIVNRNYPLTQTGSIDVDILIPAKIAENNDMVTVTHKATDGDEKFIEKVEGGKVTITVEHFSEFEIKALSEDDVDLDSLTLTNVSGFTFDKDTEEYTLEVANTVSETTVTATATDGLTISIGSGADKAAAEAAYADVSTAIVDLTAGENVILVKVAAGDINKVYTITITRAEATEVIPDEPGTTIPGGGGGGSSNVSVPSAPGGSVKVDNNGAKEGDTVTITTTPNKGKVVDTVTVTDADGKNVPVTDLGNGKYSFVMPKGKVTVKVTFADDTSTGFTDVAADAYYADAVAWAVEKGITNGISDTMFGPENSCTRGQMVTFLWRLAGSPKASGTNPFADVASGSYYYDAVIWAVANGITNGTSDNTFSPEDTVTRGQSVTFLYRYAGMPASGSSNGFVDVAADAFYANAVNWAAANGVTNGTSDNTFTPEANCTRGQIVTFMFRYAG